MGGKRLKFPRRKKFIPKDKELGKYEEEKKEHDPEKFKELLDLWKERKNKEKAKE